MFDGGFKDGAAGIGDGAAPYVSWPASEASFGQMKAVGVPDDQVRQEHLSGLGTRTVITQAMAMFRFMGLTDAEDRPMPLMHEFVAAFGTPDWPRVLRGAVERAYPRIVALDLSRATRQQLDEAFKAYPSSSDAVRKKAVTFFLSAARAAGIPLSAELAEPRRRPGGTALRQAAADHATPDQPGAPDLFPNPSPDQPSPTVVALPQAREPGGAPSSLAPQTPAALYRAAYVSLKAAWNPGELPEEEEDAFIQVLRILRRMEREVEATKP